LYFSKKWNPLIAGRYWKLQLLLLSTGVESERRAIRDNLRNFLLSPPAEMLSLFQQLRGTL
jgi:hypothetical protein